MAEALRSGSWGAFGISAVQPGKRGGKYGAYSIRCLFHTRNPVPGCTREFRIQGAGRTDQALVARRCLWWASQARDVDRQWKHLTLPDIEDDALPSWEVLQLRRIDERPPKHLIRNGIELDSQAALVPVLVLVLGLSSILAPDCYHYYKAVSASQPAKRRRRGAAAASGFAPTGVAAAVGVS